MKFFFVLLFLSSQFIFCFYNHPLHSGVNQLTINHRKILVELPKTFNPTQKYPVVFGFHGAGGHERAYNRRLAPYVNSYGMITVSILGTNNNPNGPATWNFSKFSKTNADDLGLVQEIIKILESQNLIDSTRIYATGASAGGLFAYYLAVKTELFAAVAPTKCGMVKDEHKPTPKNSRVSVFQVIGDQDKSYHGSQGPIQMYSARERIDLWLQAKNCSRTPKVVRELGISFDKTYNCPGSQVRLLTLDGIGHRLGLYWTQKTDQMIIEFFMKDSASQ